MSTVASLAILTHAATESTDSILVGLMRFGSPSLCLMSRGWFCYVKMNVSAVGTTMDVQSEMTHTTPQAAARECAERVIATVKQFSS